MTIIQLQYLIEVANCGSFSAASEHCFVTQPSLSMQIKALEEELGVILLDRSKKPVIPTEAGAVVITQAQETLKAYDTIRESVRWRNFPMIILAYGGIFHVKFRMRSSYN